MSNVDRRRSYRPGGWFGIFGDNASVLLPPTEKHRVTALWELIDEGAGFDEVLDGLLSSGLRGLPGFVLVSEAAGLTKVVLRGPAVAAFVVEGEMIELAGVADTTWVERSLVDVTQMFVQVEATEEEEGVDLLIENGLVRLGRIDQPPFTLEAESVPEPEPEPEPEPQPEPSRAPAGVRRRRSPERRVCGSGGPRRAGGDGRCRRRRGAPARRRTRSGGRRHGE